MTTTKESKHSMTKTNGHPIKWHSAPPTGQYHQMPNEITRDNTLGNNGYRVLGILYSHVEGYEVSANGIAKAMGWGWKRAASGLKDLVQARYLVIQPVVTAKRTAVSEVYHITRDGSRFSDTDVARLSTPLVLPDPLSKRQNALCQNDIGPSAKTTEQRTPKKTSSRRPIRRPRAAAAAAAVAGRCLRPLLEAPSTR